MFVFGIVLALLGTLFGLPETRARLQTDLARQGDLFLLLYLGLAAATLVVGPLIDRIGNKLVLICSALLVTACSSQFVPASVLSFQASASINFDSGAWVVAALSSREKTWMKLDSLVPVLW